MTHFNIDQYKKVNEGSYFSIYRFILIYFKHLCNVLVAFLPICFGIWSLAKNIYSSAWVITIYML